MLSWVKHEKSFITLGSDLGLHYLLFSVRIIRGKYYTRIFAIIPHYQHMHHHKIIQIKNIWL